MSRSAFLWPACLAALFLTTAAREARAVSVGVGHVNYSPPNISGGTFDPADINTATGEPNGFSTGGSYDFTASGGDATITYTATEKFRITIDPTQLTQPGNLPPGTYLLAAGLSGFFSDLGNPNAELTQYTNQTSLLGVASVTVGDPFASDPPVPISQPFLGARVALSGAFPLSPGIYTLEQDTTMAFSGLLPGDKVLIELPNGSNLNPTPEPGTLTLLGGMTVLGMAFYGWRRRKERLTRPRTIG